MSFLKQCNKRQYTVIIIRNHFIFWKIEGKGYKTTFFFLIQIKLRHTLLSLLILMTIAHLS